MRIVDVEGDLLRQQGHVVTVQALEVLDRILERRGGEEVVLLEAQHLALVMAVLRIENLGDHLGQLPFLHRAGIVTAGEGSQVDALRRTGRPHAQRVDRLGIVADDRDVVGHGDDGLVILQLGKELAVHPMLLDMTAEVHLDGILERGDVPVVAVFQPAVRHLDLLAVDDALAEQAVFVTDGAAHRGQIQRRERIHKARGQTAQTAVAGSRFGLLVEHLAHFQPEIRERRLVFLGRAQIEQIVVHPAAGEELDGEVVEPLFVFILARLLGVAPLFHDLIANGRGNRLVNLLRRRLLERAAVIALQLAQNRLLDMFLIVNFHQRHGHFLLYASIYCKFQAANA